MIESINVVVDDIVFRSTMDSQVHNCAIEMKKEFQTSMIGELTYFLVLQVKQFEEGIFIPLTKYAKDLIKRIGLDGKSHARTPMNTSVKLGIDLPRKSVDQTLFHSMIGSLLYLIASNPNKYCL